MKKLLLCFGIIISQASFAQTAMMQDFEDAAFPPDGWTVVNTNPTNNWERAVNDNVIAGDGSAFVGWDNVANSDEILISPSFSLVGYTVAYLNFTTSLGYAYMVDPDPNADFRVSVSVDGGTTWTQVWVEEDEGVYADYEPISKRIDISTIAAGEVDVKVRFQYVGFDADIVVLDDISVSACPPISNLRLSEDVTDTTIAFQWESTATNCEIEYGAPGFTQGTGTVVTSDMGSYSFTGLEPGTGYSFYFRSTCGALATSFWDGPYTLYTTLSSPTALPYSYGFEVPNFVNGGWSSATGGTGNEWNQYNDAPFAYEGTRFSGLIGSTTAVTDAWMFSRGLNLVGDSEIVISYYMRKSDLGDGVSDNNSMVVSIGTDNTPEAQATTLDTFENIADDEYVLREYIYNVPVSGVYYIGFHGTTGIQDDDTQGGIMVDNFSVTGETAGTNDVLASKLSIFPNPATNVINITNNSSILVDGVQIADLNGRTVKSLKFSGVTEAQVNVSDLANGMYMMTVSSDKGTMTQKIVKN